jgi:predicted RNA-binding protein with TRAM domain
MNPIGVGEEYIVNIEETSKSGTGVAKIRGFVVLVNNSNPGEDSRLELSKLVAFMQWLLSFSNNVTK